MLTDKLPRLIFPAIAVWFASYMIYEQLTGNYRSSTQNYVVGLALIVLVMCLVIVISVLLGRDTGAKTEAQPELAETDPAKKVRNASRIGLLVIMAALLVATFETVGYLIGFTLFLALTLRLLDVRKYWLIGAITAVTMSVVHFIFVQWLGVNLPMGVLLG